MKQFEKEKELQKVKARLTDLNALLNIDKTENVLFDSETDVI